MPYVRTTLLAAVAALALNQPSDEGLTIRGNGTLGVGATTISHASVAVAGVFLGGSPPAPTR